jgi:hypothetical protein
MSQSSHPRRGPGRVAGASTIALGLEALEDRALLSGNTISGIVYHDLNNNGLKDANEVGLADVTVQLRDASNQLVAQTNSGPDGVYYFNVDQRVTGAAQTKTYALPFGDSKTNFVRQLTLPQFNPALGKLVGVDFHVDGHITSTIRVEHEDDEDGARLTAVVSGSIQVTGPQATVNAQIVGTPMVFDAAPYDGNTDFAGPSGKTFGTKTANGGTTFTLTNPNDLQAYVGTGSLTLSAKAVDTSSVTGNGNLTANIVTTAGGLVTVTYRYVLNNDLKPGSYTVVETQPAGFMDGQDAQNNVPIPNSIGRDFIPVQLINDNSFNNNFGELKSSSLAGWVYLDLNNNGIKDANETGIGNVTVKLTGTDATGKTVTKVVKTNADGSYSFTGLTAGTYKITETQPTAYLDGKDTVGTLGGNTTKNDEFSAINLPPGVDGVEYNFGERLKATPNVPPPVNPGTPTPSGKGAFIWH